MSRKIRNIILDFGGVVIDLDRNAAVSRFRQVGIDNAENMLGQFWHNGLFNNLEKGDITADQFYQELRRETGKNLSDEEIDSGWLAFIKDVPQHRLDYIKKLRENYNLYLLSNTNPIVMKWALTPEFSQEGRSLDSYFDKLYLSYKIKSLKPDRSIYEYLLRDSGAVAEETIFLDDSQVNLNGAAELGINTMLTINCQDWMDELENRLKG